MCHRTFLCQYRPWNEFGGQGLFLAFLDAKAIPRLRWCAGLATYAVLGSCRVLPSELRATWRMWFLGPGRTLRTSAVVELCRARAAKCAEPLTNSENACRDAEKPVKNGCGTGSGLACQPSPLETERRSETQVRRNIGAIRGGQPSTNGRGIQFEAGVWLLR
jgi:hypothetical protein